MTSALKTGHLPPGASIHPHHGDAGEAVIIRRPSKATPLEAWSDATAIGAVVPGGQMPPSLSGVVFQPWEDPPTNAESWERLARTSLVEDPPFSPPKGFAPAAGVVIREPDGRFWLVAPTNQFGGYEVTFPKGRPDGKSLKAAALIEAYEESGLRVRLLKHLLDIQRSQTYTRYYLAERLGGTPAAMGWESQCVLLVPVSQMPSLQLAVADKLVLESALSAAT